MAVRSDEDRLDGHDCVRRMSHDPMTWAHVLFFFFSHLSDFDRIVMTRPHVSPRCAKIAIDLRSFDVHLRDRRLQIVHVLLMTIGWTLVHTIDTLCLVRSHAHASFHHMSCKEEVPREHSPTGRKKGE